MSARLALTGRGLSRSLASVSASSLSHGDTRGKEMSVSHTKIAIGGHRGSGANLLRLEENTIYPRHRENTLKSLQQAAQAGAAFLEFDLQVTKCGNVVLWHDDEVIYTGENGKPVQCGVSDLTLQEFQDLCLGKNLNGGKDVVGESSSVGATDGKRTRLLREFDGFCKPAPSGVLTPWICNEDDGLPTLDAVFNAIPEHVDLNLEVKVALPSSVKITPTEEVRRLVEPILACVERYTGSSKRNLVLSSFDPDVAAELRRRQDRFPVFFLSGIGAYEHVDTRRTSPEAAIKHAANCQLAGIVVPAGKLLQNPTVVEEARKQDLVVLTYGRDNNLPENVVAQARLGVIGAILDEVQHVVTELRMQSGLSLEPMKLGTEIRV